MVARNDVTGDAIQTKTASQSYRDNYDLIFRKDKTMQVRADQIKEGGVPCGCGRSPTGFCIGWHGLSEEEFQKRLAEHTEKSVDKTNQ